MLTPEDQKRIEEEEAYRAEMRAKHDKKSGSLLLRIVRGAVICYLVAVGIAFIGSIISGIPETLHQNIVRIQRDNSIRSQMQAHPTCSGIFGYGPGAQSFCDGLTGLRTVPMPQR